MIELRDYQKEAIEYLRTGSILHGGVGSGKSITSLSYYVDKVCSKKVVPLYIITTARKRDTQDWEKEASQFLFEPGRMTVDSWNNIKKYVGVTDAFFIFDEQRVVGYGMWSKSFIEISKKNNWILLSATPGDCWMDYVPVFIANGFFKNKTQFEREHVIWNRHTTFPSVQGYYNTGRLMKYRQAILVDMEVLESKNVDHRYLVTEYDTDLYKATLKNRWNYETEEPFKTANELCIALRKIVNTNPNKLKDLDILYRKHNKVIVFYNYLYELKILKDWCTKNKITYAEWNGQVHQLVPVADQWIYLVQYTAGAEGWNCIETNAIVFFSENYSYKIMHQSAGRINRMNSTFTDLYYYHFITNSSIDRAIMLALKRKKSFSESAFTKSLS